MYLRIKIIIFSKCVNIIGLILLRPGHEPEFFHYLQASYLQVQGTSVVITLKSSPKMEYIAIIVHKETHKRAVRTGNSHLHMLVVDVPT